MKTLLHIIGITWLRVIGFDAFIRANHSLDILKLYWFFMLSKGNNFFLTLFFPGKRYGRNIYTHSKYFYCTASKWIIFHLLVNCHIGFFFVRKKKTIWIRLYGILRTNASKRNWKFFIFLLFASKQRSFSREWEWRKLNKKNLSHEEIRLYEITTFQTTFVSTKYDAIFFFAVVNVIFVVAFGPKLAKINSKDHTTERNFNLLLFKETNKFNFTCEKEISIFVRVIFFSSSSFFCNRQTG